MPSTEQEIISDIKKYIQQGGGTYSAWYVGISQKARDRLFNGHGVHEKGDWWIYRQAYTSKAARNVERYFVNTLGADGGTGGGDEDADYVYAYKKSSHTDP
ncbi:MAG: hypothetical protein ACE5JO_07895 [Candidatus Binatia bacterium]